MEHQCGCSGEPGPEPTEPIGRPVGVVPTPTPLGETPRAAADGAFLEVSVPRLSVEAAGGTGWSKRSQPFDVAPGAPARPPALPSFDVALGAPARPPAWPDGAAVPELAAPLDAAPPAPPAPPPCVRAGCDAHVMRATSNKESFVVAMIRSLRLERTIHLGRYGSLTLAGVPRPRLWAHSSPPAREAGRRTFSHSKPHIFPAPVLGQRRRCARCNPSAPPVLM